MIEGITIRICLIHHVIHARARHAHALSERAHNRALIPAAQHVNPRAPPIRIRLHSEHWNAQAARRITQRVIHAATINMIAHHTLTSSHITRQVNTPILPPSRHRHNHATRTDHASTQRHHAARPHRAALRRNLNLATRTHVWHQHHKPLSNRLIKIKQT